VAPFWLAAAYAGCKPVGQREWRWLHALQQAAFFPWDFPDTPAHAALMEQQHALRAAAAARRPRGKRGLSAPPPPPPWEQLLTGVGGGSGEEEAGDGLAGAGPGPGGEQAQEMDTDGGPGAAQPALFVARSYAAMAAALHCTAGGLASAAAPLPGPRPVAAALRQGLLTWRPAAPLGTGSSPGAAPAADRSPGSGRAGDRACCLLEATVQPIRKGTVGEGAALCFVAGAEAERRRLPLTALSPRQLRRRRREAEELEVALLEMGGDPEAAAALHPSPSTHLPGAHLSHPPGISGGGGGADVAEEQLRTFGWVVAEAPRGAPRRCGARAAVLAAAAWRLRSLQAVPGGRADDGAIEALARNPGSAVLYPVRLRLLVEEPAA
jgi:ribonuclease P/MRP protein subunit POP1